MTASSDIKNAWDLIDPRSLKDFDSEILTRPIIEPPWAPISIPQFSRHGKRREALDDHDGGLQ